MSHVKSGGKTAQGTTRPGKRLGVKVFGGQQVKSGAIIVRQKGTVFHPGVGTGLGRDFTIYAVTNGQVTFGIRRTKKTVSVI